MLWVQTLVLYALVKCSTVKRVFFARHDNVSYYPGNRLKNSRRCTDTLHLQCIQCKINEYDYNIYKAGIRNTYQHRHKGKETNDCQEGRADDHEEAEHACRSVLKSERMNWI